MGVARITASDSGRKRRRVAWVQGKNWRKVRIVSELALVFRNISLIFSSCAVVGEIELHTCRNTRYGVVCYSTRVLRQLV